MAKHVRLGGLKDAKPGVLKAVEHACPGVEFKKGEIDRWGDVPTDVFGPSRMRGRVREAIMDAQALDYVGISPTPDNMK